jgi:DNA helicase-2/ATP-dependent DNA helicase PcrA
MNLTDDLNGPQRAAVTLPDESALILAGAGSGKTRVLTTRIAWLLQNGRCGPAGILAVTFTNKAAREMVTRIEGQLSVNPRGMWVGTFHGLSNRLLRAHHREAGLPQAFQILDSQDQLSAIKRLIKQANIDEERCPPRDLQYFINAAKESGQRAGALASSGHDRRWIEVFTAYDAQCQREGSVDFAELLLRTVELLTRDEALRSHYQRRFRHVLVDEFQDTNSLQYRWLKLLAGPQGRIFAVGDDDQSIYRFRGANVGNMADFQRDYAVGHLIKLEQNYRSHGNILEAANHLIGNNSRRLGKRLWTDAGAGDKLQVVEAGSDGEEAAWIVDQVRDQQRHGHPLREIALLYRANAQSRVLEHALFTAGLPYRVYGGLRFFERAEIKHALAYLRLVANPDDDLSFARIVNFPPRGIGARSVEQLQDGARAAGTSLSAAARSLPGRAAASLAGFMDMIEGLRASSGQVTLPELVDELLTRSGLTAHYRAERDGAERVENLGELVNAASAFLADYTPEGDGAEDGFVAGVSAAGPDDGAAGEAGAAGEGAGVLESFLAHASLEAGDNQAGAGQDALQLMTVHAAKGLEFDLVFVTGLEEGLFPHENSLSEADGLEEERRLMYVAITRARRRLHLSFAQSRMLHGQTRYGLPSRFLDELPPAVVERVLTRPAQPRGMGGAAAWEGDGWGSGRGASRTGAHGPGQGGGARRPAPGPVPAWAAPLAARSGPVPGVAGSDGGAAGNGTGLRVGQGVRHARFGEGVVVRLAGSGSDARAVINFGAIGTKELLLTVARLEPVVR